MLIRKQKIPFVQMATIGMLPGFIKKAFYRLKGYRISNNVTIGIGSVIIGKKVTILKNVKIGICTVVKAESISLDRFVTIGSFTIIDTGKLSIGEDSRINEQVIIGGIKTPESALTTGKRTIIMEYSYVNTTKPISIGNDSGVGGHCLLFTHGSWLNQLEGFPVTFAPITIGENVWLPWRVFVMPGVTIGDKVVIGANSLINKDIQSNTLVAGAPAKIIKENYPVALTETKKKELIKHYILEFTAHLQYHELNSETVQNDGVITVTVHGRKNECLIVDQTGNYPDKIPASAVFIIVSDRLVTEPFPQPYKNQLILDLSGKQRIGTSSLGEEFVKFLSRYGLRFNRLD